MHILVVEDDLEIRAAIHDILEMEGHTCTVAVDGQNAIEILGASSAFDLMMTDLRMPNVDGVELLHWCRANNIHFPVIFVSANSNLVEREKIALADPRASMLAKPFQIGELLDAIEAVGASVSK